MQTRQNQPIFLEELMGMKVYRVPELVAWPTPKSYKIQVLSIDSKINTVLNLILRIEKNNFNLKKNRAFFW